MNLVRTFFLLPLLAAGSVQAGELFSPVTGDMSISLLLQPLFGSLFGGTGDGPLGEAIMTFNICCLTIGGLLAAYTMVFGTMQTAHDGEMLGKRWSSMWVPVRLAVGTAALVPIGSFCAIQMLVGWMVIQGVGLADTVWMTFTRSAIASDSLAAGTAPATQVSRLAFGMLRSQVCMEGFKRLATEGESAYLIFNGLPTSNGSLEKVRRYGVPDLSLTQCGGVVGSQANPSTMASVAGAFGINTGAAEKAAAIRRAHTTATQALETEMSALAAAIVNGQTADVQARYMDAINNYQRNVSTAAKAEMGDAAYFAQMADNASRDGWLLTGAWFMRLVALESSMLEALADAPTSIPIEAAPPSMASDMNRYYYALNGAVRDPSTTGVDNQLLADKEREDSESGVIMSIINGIFNKINDGTKAGFNFLTDADAERHPLMVATGAGHTMIGWGLALAVASVIAAKIGGVTVAMVLAGFIMALIAGGVSLAYLLPMMPFILWVGACCGWLLVVIEGVLGAPLWAVSHLNPRGEEFHGGAGVGYMLVLEMTLKPVLMVFGFCFAVVASMPLGQFINRVFYATFQLNQGGFVGFVGMLAAMGIYAALMLSMMKYTFSFIHKIPDQLLRWMGGGRGSGLAEAAGAAGASEHQSGAVVGALGGAVAGAMTSKLNSMSRQGIPAETSKGDEPIQVVKQASQEISAHDNAVQSETDSAFKEQGKQD